MGWNTPVDIYCERTDAAFWAEPVNAVTNAAFVLAGVAALMLARRRGRLDGPVMLTAALVIAIGVGSFLFHTVARRWAALADVLPIAMFVLVYLTIAFRAYFGLRWWLAALAMVLTLAVGAGVTMLLAPVTAAWANGSESYFPALFALFLCGGALAVRGHGAGAPILAAGALFALSIAFRAGDAHLCEALPLGVHFMWHLLNAAVLLTLLVTLVMHGRAPLAKPGTGG